MLDRISQSQPPALGMSNQRFYLRAANTTDRNFAYFKTKFTKSDGVLASKQDVLYVVKKSVFWSIDLLMASLGSTENYAATKIITFKFIKLI